MMDRMEISSAVDASGVRIVRAEGIVDAFTYIDFKKFLTDLCDDAGSIHVIVDLTRVSYISSSGWSVLLSRRMALRKHGGDLSIAGLCEGPRRIYESLRIQQMLPAAASAGEALKLMHLSEAA